MNVSEQITNQMKFEPFALNCSAALSQEKEQLLHQGYQIQLSCLEEVLATNWQDHWERSLIRTKEVCKRNLMPLITVHTWCVRLQAHTRQCVRSEAVIR